MDEEGYTNYVLSFRVLGDLGDGHWLEALIGIPPTSFRKRTGPSETGVRRRDSDV